MLCRLITLSLSACLAGLAAVPSLWASEAARPRLDDYALRYYASLGQKDRVDAEAKRLSALDPDWQMPHDLYSAKAGRADEAPLWDLYGQNRIADIEAAIAQRRAAEPGWEPSADLQAKIKAKTLRATVMALARKQNWHAVVQSVKESGIAWAADDAEALWIIAEASAHEDDCGEAYVVYHAIMTGHPDTAERRATIERAMATIPMAMTEKLIALGHVDSSGRSEFDPIAVDIARARISAYLHDEPANIVEGDELKRFEDAVRDDPDPNQPGLVAWYAFKRQDYPLALDWFKIAIARGGDAMVAHGLAHTLRKLGMKREAEEVAYAWREPLVNNAILFIDLLEEDFTRALPSYIEPARMQRYAQVTMATESGEGAQALAWYAYNTCQYPLALQWFERAVAWLPKEATVYGYALALQRLRKSAEFRTVVNRYDGLFPQAVALAFDDGQRRPPPACESNQANPPSPSQMSGPPPGDGAGADWTGRTMADTLRPKAIAVRTPDAGRAASRRAAVPSPDDAFAGSDPALTSLVKKTDFPVAVGPENPLRFSALRTNAAVDGDDHLRGRVGLGPLVARRVLGIGAMPYERFGFTLRPGYDGTKDASSPTSAERDAPAGTLWALEQSLHKGGTVKPSKDGAADTILRAPPATNLAGQPNPSNARL